MKKFIIISLVLVLAAVGVFVFAMFRYANLSDLFDSNTSESESESADETEAADTGKKDSPVKAPSADKDAAPAAKDVFAEGNAKAKTYVAGMTKEQMVGQLIVGVCPDASTASAQINEYNLAGFLFERANFEGMSAEEINASLKAASKDSTIRPILAAQEEGGTITTISDLPAYGEYDFNPPRSEYDQNGLHGLQSAEDKKTQMLKSAGFNMNIAPVVDVVPSGDQIMYSRAVSGDVKTVCEYAEYVSKFNQARGVSAVLSHFPGYGTIPDSAVTGEGAVVDDRPAETIRSTDYQPFEKGAAEGAHCIMMSNTVVQNIDPDHTAALSPSLHSELRNKVGFTGLIMADLLDDADYSAYADGKKPVVQAVIAGNDLILVRDYATAYNDLLAAVNDGTITEAQLKEACTRVIAYKYTAGIMK